MKRITLTLALCCALHMAHTFAAQEPWQSLSPSEKEALSPVYPQWNSLPETQQRHLRHLAQHYAGLSMDGKRRFLSRLATWAQLTPAQRQAAREKYRAFSQVPAEKREQVKQMIKQKQVAQQPASAVVPATTQSAPLNQP